MHFFDGFYALLVTVYFWQELPENSTAWNFMLPFCALLEIYLEISYPKQYRCASLMVSWSKFWNASEDGSSNKQATIDDSLCISVVHTCYSAMGTMLHHRRAWRNKKWQGQGVGIAIAWLWILLFYIQLATNIHMHCSLEVIKERL